MLLLLAVAAVACSVSICQTALRVPGDSRPSFQNNNSLVSLVKHFRCLNVKCGALNNHFHFPLHLGTVWLTSHWNNLQEFCKACVSMVCSKDPCPNVNELCNRAMGAVIHVWSAANPVGWGFAIPPEFQSGHTMVTGLSLIFLVCLHCSAGQAIMVWMASREAPREMT